MLVCLSAGSLECGAAVIKFGTFTLPIDLRSAGSHAGAAIICDKNILREGDMVALNENDPWGGEVTVILAREFLLEGALPVNENFSLRVGGVTGAVRFRARRIARGREGGVGRVSGRIRNRPLLEGPRAYPAT